jgi:hypothetical protein
MRISTTALDGYQYYLDGKIEQEDYISNLVVIKDSPAMKIGRAFETVLHSPHQYDKYNYYVCDGIKFDNNLITDSLEYINHLAKPTWQSKIVKQYDIGGENVNLVGVADILNGNEIIDIKTTARFDYERYFWSWQWRAYLELFELDLFKYFVAEYKTNNDVIEMNHLYQFEFYRYPDMEIALNNILTKFVKFIKEMELDALFCDK